MFHTQISFLRFFLIWVQIKFRSNRLISAPAIPRPAPRASACHLKNGVFPPTPSVYNTRACRSFPLSTRKVPYWIEGEHPHFSRVGLCIVVARTEPSSTVIPRVIQLERPARELYYERIYYGGSARVVPPTR
jgi:hypothetical protein